MTQEVIDIAPTTAALATIDTQSALVAPAASFNTIVQAFKDYQLLREKLLTPDDFQKIGKGRFVKKSGWRKLAVAFGVSDEIIRETLERHDDGSIRRAEVVVRATAPNGRFSEGVGLCDISERSFSKPEHDIPATAHTRAKSRAFSDLFGMGEVSAEEMSSDVEMPTWRPAPKPRTDALVKEIIERDMQAWVKDRFQYPYSAEDCDQIDARIAEVDRAAVDGDPFAAVEDAEVF